MEHEIDHILYHFGRYAKWDSLHIWLNDWFLMNKVAGRVCA